MLIQRKEYLDKLIAFKNKQIIENTGSESDLAGKYVDYLENSSFPYDGIRRINALDWLLDP